MRRCVELSFLLLSSILIVVFTHYWVADRNKLRQLIFPVEAVFAPVNCSEYAPEWLEESMGELISRMRALSNQVAFVDSEGQYHHCETGWKDKPFGMPLLANTLFRYGSLTKPVTAAALLKLELGRKVNLDSKLISVLLPDVAKTAEIANRIDEIRVRDLLTHKSGLGGRFGAVFTPQDRNQPWCPYHLEKILSGRLRSVPGTQSEYSNGNYCLLGALIARIQGVPVAEAIDQILSLSARGLHFLGNTIESDEVWRDYRHNDFFDGRSFKPNFYLESIYATGGLAGSALSYANLLNDLVSANLDGFISSPKDVQGCDISIPRNCYGHAFYLFQANNGLLLNVKEGYYPGASGMVVISEAGEIFVWLGNSDTDDARAGRQQKWLLEHLSKILE